MSLVQHLPDRGPSPSLSINLNSNNPFRRTASPTPPSPVKSASPDKSSKHMSRNPFLDPSSVPLKPQSPEEAATSRMADDIFRDVNASGQPTANGKSITLPPRSGAMPVSQSPSRPREGEARRRDPRAMKPGERNPFDSPDKQRLRRNSESSIHDKEAEEKRRRERRKEREARKEREGKPKDGRPSRSKRPQGLDVIDKLDVTGIYGQGLFHHDGPFDACNPHRNRKAGQRAPMQAFPAGSANNALGGAAPKTFDHDKFHGRGEEGFADFGSSAKDYTTEPAYAAKGKQTEHWHPTQREQIHGEESYGLGTSTFLEGAPASRTAVQRRESETQVPQYDQSNGGGLGRKKSLAMRIRGLSNTQARRPAELSAGRVTSPDGYGRTSPDSPPYATQSAGGPSRAKPIKQENNPFFRDEYDEAYDKKGAQIKIAETTGGRARAPSSPNRGLVRSITADNPDQRADYDEAEKPAGGFLNRMKSLKGGRRARPDRIGS